MNKIMFVIPSIRNGGAERVITRLSSGLIDAGYEIHILEFFRPLTGYAIDPRVHLHALFQSENEYNQTSFLQKNRLIRRAVLEAAPDAIIPFLEYVCQKTQLALAFTRYFSRIVVTLRNSPTAGSLSAKGLRLISIILSAACIAQTDRQMQYFPRSLQHKFVTIPNPVEYVEEPFCECAEKVRFVAAGRLVAQKNYPLMLSAFAKTAKSRDVYLDIFGVGELKNELMQMIQSLNISDRVTLKDYSQNLTAEYRKSSIYILTSDWEGMPNALLEAMALGMPCIATDCPTGPAELMPNEHYGLLVPMKDGEALTKAMIKLIDSPKMRESTGRMAREYVLQKYGLERITSLWIDALTKRGLIDSLSR